MRVAVAVADAASAEVREKQSHDDKLQTSASGPSERTSKPVSQLVGLL